MKAEITEAQGGAEPAIRLVAENEEERTSLWLLHKLGPAAYVLAENEEGGDAQVVSIVLEGVPE